MIKGIILDVDGVIVGQKKGLNSPYPHPLVIHFLKKLSAKGILIILCSGKAFFAIEHIIKLCNLDNPHIGDGGAVIIDPINQLTVNKHIIGNNLAQMIIADFLKNGVYTEMYSAENYYVQKNQLSRLTKIHSHILQKEPTEVPYLLKQARKTEVVKIMPVAKNEKELLKIEKIFQPYKDDLTLHWGKNPYAPSLYFVIVTTLGISKKQSVIDVFQSLNIPFKYVLGVGDQMIDWEFMQLCQYVGAIGNASIQLKEKVLAKNKNNSYIGPSVDENGIIDIIKHFQK